MTHSSHASQHQTPWNKDKITGQKAPFKLKDIYAIRIHLQLEHKTRDLALFNLAIDSKLRGCDLVKLKVKDIAHGNAIEKRAIILQQKTQKTVQFEITDITRQALSDWIQQAGLQREDYLFKSRQNDSQHLSTRQYRRIVDSWVTHLGLDPSAYGTHSLRRTKVTLIYRKTKNLRAIQLLLGHSKLESTVRYLGIEVDDALELAEQTDV